MWRAAVYLSVFANQISNLQDFFRQTVTAELKS